MSAVERSLHLIESLAAAPDGLSLGALASGLDLPKSAVHRLLATLTQHGYVMQDSATQDYRLSLKLAVLGFRFLDESCVPDAAQQILDGLARETGEYCRIAIVEGERLVWIARAQGATSGLRYEPDMSQEVALHATATGKAWLATLPEEEALRIACARGLGAPRGAGENAVRTVSDLRDHLAQTRRRGYAVAVEEGEAGTVALAATFRAWEDDAAPVAGTVSVAGPLTRLPRDRRTALAMPLRAAAGELSRIWPFRRRQAASPRDAAPRTRKAAAR